MNLHWTHVHTHAKKKKNKEYIQQMQEDKSRFVATECTLIQAMDQIWE